MEYSGNILISNAFGVIAWKIQNSIYSSARFALGDWLKKQKFNGIIQGLN